MDRFISRRVEKILLLSEPTDCRYCPTSWNPADVASRPDGVRQPEARRLWYEGPDFLKQNVNESVIKGPSVLINRVACGQESEALYFPDNIQLDKLIESYPSLYVLTKRVAYLAAFVDYIRCKAKNREFVPPRLDTCDLDMALNRIVGFVQRKYYGQTLSLMRSDSPESLTEAIEKCGRQNSGQPKKWLKELRALNRFRPCVDNEGLVRAEGRLSNSPELTEDMKHFLILPSECALTRLVVLQYHVDSCHVGVQHIGRVD